jgi:copper chaperone CopZ
MKNLFIYLSVFLFSFMTWADNPPKDHEPHKQKPSMESVKTVNPEKALVKVNGMVCSFCAQGIEKNFRKKDEVKEVSVDLDNMLVTLNFKKGKSLSQRQIQEVIEGAGFKFMEMQHE